ncbi:MAG TPA: trypsin-like peptidase domain-containing protein [Verrucomicrobiae bacterium]|nr:trypsin-like peptidase domain-containing protein [Verrucomicrobiae bacterium]
MKMRTGFCVGTTLLLASISVTNSATPNDDSSADLARDPVVIAVQKVLPAVVNISTERIVRRRFNDPFADFYRQFFGLPPLPRSEGVQSLGSGVIVDEDGWIITNWHVVRPASKITVVLSDGTKFDARYVSGDEKNDLALLKIQPTKPLTAVVIGEGQPLLGETVVAIGNPFGFDHTVTRGVISARNRSWPLDNPQFTDVLQTDAAINPGNSGGPLINARGQLVGINMAILSEAQGIGFAIPSSRVANLLAAWFSPEKRAHVWLGMRFQLGAGGIVLAEVKPESPAAKAGARKGDEIVTVDGQRYRDVLRLERMLVHESAGDVVRFEVQRGGEVASYSVTLASLPKLSARDLMSERFGLEVQPLTPALARAAGVPGVHGLIVSSVQHGSPADRAGFFPQIVIAQVGGEPIDSMERLAEQLSDVEPGDRVNMSIIVVEGHGDLTVQEVGNVSLKAR